MLPLSNVTPSAGAGYATLASFPTPPPTPPASGRTLTQEETAEGTYVRTDLTSTYAGTPWPMLPPTGATGTVEHFYRSFVQDRPSGVFVVYDRVIVRPPASPFRLRADRRQGPWPAPPFVQGYFAPTAPGALGLEVRNLIPSLPTDEATPGLFELATDPAPDAETIDAPFLTVLRYTDAAAPDLRTLLVRSRSGNGMTGVRVQAGGAARFFFFNTAPGASPAPVVTVELPSEAGASWVLFGLKPGASYAANIEGPSLVVTERAGAPHTVSLAGVLQIAAVPGQHLQTFTYALSESGPVRVALCDTRGREVAVLAEGVHTPGRHVLPLTGIVPGQYVMQIMMHGNIHTQRITVPG